MKYQGKVLHQDNHRVVELITLSDGGKQYRIHQMKKKCTYCKREVHKDSGGFLMNEKVIKLRLPKFFCNKHYIETKKLLKQLK